MLRVVVLTSRESFIFYSTQEVIPYIETTWQSVASDEVELLQFNIDVYSIAELTPRLIGADKLVITCFNYRMCKVMQYIREILKLNISFLTHVHNLSTIAFWPYRYFASSDLFLANDVFITSCENDKRVLQKVFVDPIVHVIPFFTLTSAELPEKQLSEPDNIVYVGRISPQKNIHNLILAYARLRKHFSVVSVSSFNMPLILFGKEDFLGSPNMNIRNDSYLEFLKNLCNHLEITSNVFFKGQIDRETVDDFLQEKSSLFVSVSLHSDENFGMSVLKSLLSKNLTVLSDWGGHSDFKTYFADLVELVPVVQSDYGPVVLPDHIVSVLKKCVERSQIETDNKVNPYYLKSYYMEEQKKALSHSFDPNPLKYTYLADKIFEAKMDYTDSRSQIFKGFDDPLFSEISRYYIGPRSSSNLTTASNLPDAVLEFESVPWLSYANETFLVDDPQKGLIQFRNDADLLEKDLIAAPGPVYQIHVGKQVRIKTSRQNCERLFRCGYIMQMDKTSSVV